MAPKAAKDKLPKAAEEFKQLLLKSGSGEITPESVADKTFSKQRNAASSAMRHHLKTTNPDKFAAYQELSSDKLRNEWVAEYLLDVESGGCVGKNLTERVSTSTDSTVWVWLTLPELGGPRWLNSEENAQIAITSMRERLHSTNEALANAGVMEYRHTIKRSELARAIREGARVDQSVQIDPSDYEKVRAHMAESRNPGHSGGNQRSSTGNVKKGMKRKGTSELTEESPEQKAWHFAKEEATKSNNTLKVTFDRVEKELGQVSLIEANLRTKKWDTSLTIKFLEEETTKVREQNKTLQEAWINGKHILCNPSVTTEELKTCKVNADLKATAGLDVYKTYSKEVLADFAKLK